MLCKSFNGFINLRILFRNRLRWILSTRIRKSLAELERNQGEVARVSIEESSIFLDHIFHRVSPEQVCFKRLLQIDFHISAGSILCGIVSFGKRKILQNSFHFWTRDEKRGALYVRRVYVSVACVRCSIFFSCQLNYLLF